MKSKPKIAVIGLKGLPAFGGAAAVGENIIEQLKDQFEFTVYATSSHTELKTGKYHGYNQIVFKNVGSGTANTFVYYFKCLIHCLFCNYDLVHLHHSSSGFITPIIRFRHKVVVTFHGIFSTFDDPKFSKLQNRLFRFFEILNIRFANQKISVSEIDQQYLEKKYQKKIGFIPNGININKQSFSNDAFGKYIFFAAGRIYEVKGLHLLIDALRNIGFLIPLAVAGNLTHSPKYRTKIMKMCEGQKIQFLGLIKDRSELMKLIKNAQFFIFPSLKEAMSMMLLEVVSLKTPVIASDIPANKSMFDNDEILFFKSNNVDDLSKKIQYAFDNPEKMQEKAHRAFVKLKKDYTWEKIALEYKAIFNTLLQS